MTLTADGKERGDERMITKRIPGSFRLVEVSANTGAVRRVLGVNFRTSTDAYEYAVGYLGLPTLDFDRAPIWTVRDEPKLGTVNVTVQRQV